MGNDSDIPDLHIILFTYLPCAFQEPKKGVQTPTEKLSGYIFDTLRQNKLLGKGVTKNTLLTSQEVDPLRGDIKSALPRFFTPADTINSINQDSVSSFRITLVPIFSDQIAISKR